MKRVLTMPAAIVMLLLLAVPVSAQDGCTEPESDFDDREFLCGQIGVTLEAEANATIEEVLARSAPDAEVIKTEGPSDEHYRVDVPVGDEWANVQALREDADVEHASLVGFAYTTVPDTAMAVPTQAGLIALTTLVGLAMAATATLLVLRKPR